MPGRKTAQWPAVQDRINLMAYYNNLLSGLGGGVGEPLGVQAPQWPAVQDRMNLMAYLNNMPGMYPGTNVDMPVPERLGTRGPSADVERQMGRAAMLQNVMLSALGPSPLQRQPMGLPEQQSLLLGGQGAPQIPLGGGGVSFDTPEPRGFGNVQSGSSSRDPGELDRWISPLEQAGKSGPGSAEFEAFAQEYGYPAAYLADLGRTGLAGARTGVSHGMMGAGQLMEYLGPVGGALAGRMGKEALESGGAALYDYGRAQGTAPGQVLAGASTTGAPGASPAAPGTVPGLNAEGIPEMLARPPEGGAPASLQAKTEAALQQRAQALAAAQGAGGMGFTAPGGGGGGAAQGAEGGSIYDLDPRMEALLGRFEELGRPEPVPRAEPGERLANVLGGLAAGASGYVPGSGGGGLARALAGAGAGGQQAEAQWLKDQREAQYADQEAMRQYNIASISLESQMRQEAAKMDLAQQTIQARHVQNQLRAMSNASKDFWRANGVKGAIQTDSGVMLYTGNGQTRVIPPLMNAAWFVSNAENLKNMGASETDVSTMITNEVAKLDSDAPVMQEPRALAIQMVVHGWMPEVVAAAQKKAMDSPDAMAYLTDPAKGADWLTSKTIDMLAWSIMQNPQMKETLLNKVGSPGQLSAPSPFERGLGALGGLQRGLAGMEGEEY